MIAEDMMGKKLRGSGGYAIARVTDEEQKRGNLGGPDLFLAGVGRLDEDRFEKYYCNKCESEYEGSPLINFENPNEELGEGVVLAEKGEYRCKTCNSTIAQYRKFDTAVQQATDSSSIVEKETPSTPQAIKQDKVPELDKQGFASGEVIPIQSLVGMAAYDSEAMQIGKVELVGLKRKTGGSQITIRINGNDFGWDNISKIGDIILLKQTLTEGADKSPTQPRAGAKCPSCGFQNDSDSLYCAECGAKF